LPKNNLLAVVDEISAPVLKELGLELVDIEYVKEGGDWFLRIFIDKSGGVSHRDCEAVSKRLDPLLDEKAPITRSYYLEVSSPGLNRPLKKLSDYQRYIGYKVNITTYAPLQGRKMFSGKLAGVEDGSVLLVEENGKTIISIDNVASARLSVGY